MYSSQLLLGSLILLTSIVALQAFVQSPFISKSLQQQLYHRNYPSQIQHYATIEHGKDTIHEAAGDDNGRGEIDEETTALLEEITLDQLQSLSKQNNLSTTGTKTELLLRLRGYAQKQAEKDQVRRQKQKERIELGVDEQGNGKAKHKISNAIVPETTNDNDDDDLDGVFYFSIPGNESTKSSAAKESNDSNVKVTTMAVNPQYNPSNSITAPQPPPDAKTNEDGERVVTVYSSTDQNDLTGIAAQQSRSSGNDVAMGGGYSRLGGESSSASESRPENTLAGGPFGDQSGAQRKKATGKEFDFACESVSELVYSLLAMTGAPGFQEKFAGGITPFSDEDEDGSDNAEFKSSAKGTSSSASQSPDAEMEFVGFDPSRVPTPLITQSSTSLRVSNGDALRKVMSEVDMQAIGFDGIHGDDKTKGGGHYLEVQKVGTFLEGFRKAEVRRIARETATMLLDKLVVEGVRGLEQMLMTMTKGSDDSGEGGELNDSLVKYLDDAVRDQEMKVEQLYGNQGVSVRENVEDVDDSSDKLSQLWNVTTDEDGNVIELLDPNDPEVKMALEQELRAEAAAADKRNRASATVEDPARQLLTLLTLLRERVKAEAVFSNDEKGRNLRMLAYCLHAEDEREREKIIVDAIGNALEKLDSFSELLTSSIDYAESTSHQLQPAKSRPLNIRVLKNIKDMVDDIKERQQWKSSGVASYEQNRPFS